MIKQVVLFQPSTDLNVAMGLTYSKFRVKNVHFQNTLKNVLKSHVYTLNYTSINFDFVIPPGVYNEQSYLQTFADQANLVSPVSMTFSNVYDPNSRRAVFNIVKKNTPATITIQPKATPGSGQESAAVVLDGEILRLT